ncbi:MAG: RNA-binding transcriptional accessory protein [Oscillospiraceae bacterium]|nr:RNA-binding transcriptional accessory protein [Oscillospiraceae bacterium]
MENIVTLLAQELGQKEEYVQNVVTLLDEGNTIPFIARYRKEQHGAMDDTALRTLEERLQYLRNLQKRREEVISSITEQGKMTEELAKAIQNAATLAEVEDLYRPYKQKRRTRASVAKEKGLEPLADILWAQEKDSPAPLTLAEDYVNPELGVETAEDALAGAKDIIAERVSDNADARKQLRAIFLRSGALKVTANTEEDTVYRLYYDFEGALSRLHGHQILAINRGEKEEILKVSAIVADTAMLPPLVRMFVIPGRPTSLAVREAVEDAYGRLIYPSLEREMRATLTASANEGAIHNFALNLRPLLMQPPVKGHVTLGYDPGYRNGCKLAVVDGTGKVLDTAVIYPTQPFNKVAEAKATLSRLIRKHGISHIAIGNGTASRESEKLVAELLREFPKVSYCIVNEAGASVYSASKLAAEEFPEYDVNLRSAVSIARRLQDPLAELVKIEPKAIGVGQYQHDMPQTQLEESLSGVVEDCVNAVGADVNTASAALLTYIAGLNKTTAKNIVAYREENGIFHKRSELKNVPKLGAKAFEQCAGFLRVPESADPLDRTGVHPESYKAAKTLLSHCGFSLADVGTEKISKLSDAITDETAVAEACGVGVPTLRDMVKELVKPGRDPRDELPPPLLRTDVMEISDLKPGMILTGTVRNVIDFGAFVDIGVHQDGLVHTSQIADRFIKHPSEVLSVGDVVKVMVLDVEEKRKRISLSIKQAKGKEG